MNNTIKQLPEDERPYEKSLKYGVETLSNSELLSLILRNGTKGVNVKELSSSLLICLFYPKCFPPVFVRNPKELRRAPTVKPRSEEHV